MTGPDALGARLVAFWNVHYAGAAFAGDDLIAFFNVELDLGAKMHIACTAGAANDLGDGDPVAAAFCEAVVNRGEARGQCSEGRGAVFGF